MRVRATTNRTNTMASWARHLIEAQAELDELNKDYWQQTHDERIRRDVQKGGASCGRSFSAGALSVLIDLHLDEAEDRAFIPFDDRLGESDLIDALSNPEYWAHIEQGGALSLVAWQRAEAERASLYAKPDDDMSDDEWKRLHELDLMLGY